jgi:enolase
VAAVIGIYLGSGFYGSQTSYAETLADDYANLLADYPVGSLADSYLELDWNGEAEVGQ